MPQIEQIISSIEALPEKEFERLRNWVIERDWEKWDKQIESDSVNGKLDFLIAEAVNGKQKGRLKSL